MVRPLEFLSTFLLREPPLEMRRDRLKTFLNEEWKGILISSYEAERGSSLFCRYPRCSSRVETGVPGNILSDSKGVKDLPKFKREGFICL